MNHIKKYKDYISGLNENKNVQNNQVNISVDGSSATISVSDKTATVNLKKSKYNRFKVAKKGSENKDVADVYHIPLSEFRGKLIKQGMTMDNKKSNGKNIPVVVITTEKGKGGPITSYSKSVGNIGGTMVVSSDNKYSWGVYMMKVGKDGEFSVDGRDPIAPIGVFKIGVPISSTKLEDGFELDSPKLKPDTMNKIKEYLSSIKTKNLIIDVGASQDGKPSEKLKSGITRQQHDYKLVKSRFETLKVYLGKAGYKVSAKNYPKNENDNDAIYGKADSKNLKNPKNRIIEIASK